MTTLLVVGLILLVVGIAKTSKELGEADAKNLGDVPIILAPGDGLVGLPAAGGRLNLGIKHQDGRESIKVIDGSNGEIVGQFLLGTKP